jgi:hypothetical protein
MCLIISGSSNEMRSTLLGTAGLIESIYTKNSDGLGLMYRNKRGLKTVKVLPKNAAEFRYVVEQMPDDDRAIALHARMQTHGKIDTTNCHPYTVTPGRVALMHNGILDTGNDKDVSRSDTWHFTKDFLEGPVSKYPALIHDEGFQRMLAEFIGSNRFVFMDNDGKLVIINKDQGVMHKGLWFANMYAWDPALLLPGYKARSYTLAHYSTNWDGFDRDAYDSWKTDRRSGPTWGPNREAAFLKAVVEADVDVVADALDDFSTDAITALFENYVVVDGKYSADLVGHLKDIGKALVDQDFVELKHQCGRRAEAVAEVLCYYMDVVDMPAEGEPEDPDYLYRDDSEDSDVEQNWYRQHGVFVSEEQPGDWGYTIEDPSEDIAHAGTGYLSASAARLAAIRWIDQFAEEVA